MTLKRIVSRLHRKTDGCAKYTFPEVWLYPYKEVKIKEYIMFDDLDQYLAMQAQNMSFWCNGYLLSLDRMPPLLQNSEYGKNMHVIGMAYIYTKMMPFQPVIHNAENVAFGIIDASKGVNIHQDIVHWFQINEGLPVMSEQEQ